MVDLGAPDSSVGIEVTTALLISCFRTSANYAMAPWKAYARSLRRCIWRQRDCMTPFLVHNRHSTVIGSTLIVRNLFIWCRSAPCPKRIAPMLVVQCALAKRLYSPSRPCNSVATSFGRSWLLKDHVAFTC